MCATEHVRSAIPTVTLLTFQTTLYVTQVVLALILLVSICSFLSMLSYAYFSGSFTVYLYTLTTF
jgi:hypothetical protein